MKKNLTGWVAVAFIATVAMLLSEQNVQAQGPGCPGSGGPGGRPPIAANGRAGNGNLQGFNPRQQGGGGFLQVMQMLQQAQQSQQLQRQFGAGTQQPPFARPSGQNGASLSKFFAGNSKQPIGSQITLNPNSAKGKRVAKLRERKETRRQKKEALLAKRKADKEKRIAEFKKRQAEKK